MDVKLVDFMPEPLGTIERAASFCYDSQPTKSGRIAKACIESGHDSVMEHSSFTFEVSGVSRACLAQITRHRVGVSFTVRSQRYCDESAFEFVTPPTVSRNEEAKRRYCKTMADLRKAYAALLSAGVPKEDARFVLPNACETEFTVTFNARALMHFCNLRLCNRAQWEIRELAERMRDAVEAVEPALAAYLVPTCVKLGNCPERNGCGRMMGLQERLNYEHSAGYFEALAEIDREKAAKPTRRQSGKAAAGADFRASFDELEARCAEAESEG